MEPLAKFDSSAMTVEEFERQSPDWEGRWELMGGVPVRMQAESARHSRRSRKIAILLEGLLDGHPCTPDERMDVLCGEADIRNPDVLIDCHPDAVEEDRSRALEPVVVFEVAVTSQATDLGGKHLVYFRNPHVRHYVAVLPREGRAVHFTRDGRQTILGPEDRLDLSPEPGVVVGVGDLIG